MKTKRKSNQVTTQAVRIGGEALQACQAHQRAHGCTLRQAVEALCSMLPLYPIEPIAPPAKAKQRTARGEAQAIRASKRQKGGKA